MGLERWERQGEERGYVREKTGRCGGLVGDLTRELLVCTGRYRSSSKCCIVPVPPIEAQNCQEN